MHSLLNALKDWEWLGPLVARMVVGSLFVLSGRAKLFCADRREAMQKTVREAGIPFPSINAIFVSLVEFSCGILLVAGALTPIACLLLGVVMIVAITTVRARGIEASSPLGWLSEFLYLPEVLYLTILVWLFFSGPGRFSIDAIAF